jgi:hypothetical protein
MRASALRVGAQLSASTTGKSIWMSSGPGKVTAHKNVDTVAKDAASLGKLYEVVKRAQHQSQGSLTSQQVQEICGVIGRQGRSQCVIGAIECHCECCSRCCKPWAMAAVQG